MSNNFKVQETTQWIFPLSYYMLKHRVVALFLTSCLALAGALVFNVSPSQFLPASKAQTEWVIEQDVEQQPIEGVSHRLAKRKFHILRWHNHTINFTLRNVRARWLTWQEADSRLPLTQYPEEEVSSI